MLLRNFPYILFFCLLLAPAAGMAQSVAINNDGTEPDKSAILDLSSNSKGLLIPRMDSNARKAIPNTLGLLLYDTDTHSFWYNNGSAWQNMAGGTGWLLGGNSGTSTTTHFIGTTDNVPLVIKVNNELSGLIDPAMFNAFWGFRSGQHNEQHSNTGFGAFTLSSNTIGSENVALGSQALLSNISGTANVAAGNSALRSNLYGDQNTAVGNQALMNNHVGFKNTAVGYQALTNNLGGETNTAIGQWALLRNTSGSYNVAIGDISLQSNIGGYFNVAIGGASLLNNTSGENNVAIGDGAMDNNVTGSYNSAIGYGADVGSGILSNATAIGSNATVDASNKVRIGNAAVTVIEGQVPFTTPSDGRFKFNVQEDVKGLDFIMQLRPVTYQFNVEQYDSQWKRSDNKSPVSRKSITENGVRINYTEALQLRRTGFIAQEVEKAAAASNFNFSGIVKPKTAQEHYSLSYESFVVPLVKAVQEQQEIIRDLQQQVAELRLLIRKTN